jgi:hypothetical protein
MILLLDLEDKLGSDPLKSLNAPPYTFGEFVSAYENVPPRAATARYGD